MVGPTDPFSWKIWLTSLSPRLALDPTLGAVSLAPLRTRFCLKKGTLSSGGGAVITLSDQAMPALIPTENKTCPTILRVEGGDLQEICNNFCRILNEFALPPGSIILFSSMSHLHTEGLVNYTAECINVVRRFNSMFKDKCVTIPIAPTPLCGIPDADCVRNLFDLTLWLDSTPGYCLGRYNQVVRDSLALPIGSTDSVTHYPGRLYLPANTYEFTTNRFERQGRVNFPGSIPPLSENAEPALIYTLLTELSSKYKLGMDTELNLSRRLVLTPAPPHGKRRDSSSLHRRQQRRPASERGRGCRPDPGHSDGRRMGPQHHVCDNSPSPD
jgi:hypothetical protein